MKKKKTFTATFSVKTHMYIFSMMLICLLEVAIVFSFVFHPIGFRSTIASGIYTASANWEIKNSVIVKETVDFCRPIGINKELIKCVVTNVGGHYNYTSRNKTLPQIIKTDTFNESGYMCRDIAVAYNAIFRELGLETDYIFSKNHVYNNVYYIGDEYLDCIVNMDKYGCW